jgi:multidrug resistance protein, MATE family
LAAHNVVTQLTRIAYQVSISLSQGSSILISGAIGRGDKGRAQQNVTAALVLGGITTGVLGLRYLAAPNPTGYCGRFSNQRAKW